MSQMIHTKEAAATNNANEAAVSTPKTLTIVEIVEQCAKIKIKASCKVGDAFMSTTREKFSLNREKLINSVRATWKSYHGKEAKGDRVPPEIDVVIVSESEKFIETVLKQINPLNSMNFTRKVVPNFRSDCMEEIVTAKGKNVITLKEQKLFNSIATREAEERLEKIIGKPATTPEMEQQAREKILKLKKMGLWIETTLAEANKAASAS